MKKLHHMLRAAAGAGVTPPVATDPYFMYNTLLLHGDGTNGAQNNTFVDSSTNNFTITRNGTPTQGSFSPYGVNWSNYLNNPTFPNVGGDYLQPSVTGGAVDFGTGDYTVEFWFYASGLSSGYNSLFAFTPTHVAFSLYINSYNLNFWTGGSPVMSGSTVIAAGKWYHVAIARSGTALKMFLNGALEASTSNSTNVTSNTGVRIGQDMYDSGNGAFYGYISNFRCIKGTALYTSNFTPSTTPLTAVSGTSLLTCQSNRFKDNSSNNFAITVTGTPSVQRFSPFEPSAAYSTSAIGGSGYFKGSPDYLSSSTGMALNFGTGDFTVEFWSYWSTHAAYAGMVSTSGGIIGQFQVIFNASANSLRLDIGGTQWTPSPTLTANAWTHIAVVRSGTTVTLYFNGVSVATTTNGNSVDASNLRVGADKDTSSYYVGYISNLRTVTGTAVYTAAFTPPTAPLTAISNTSLLLNFTNAGIYDNAMMNNLVTVGNAQISTSVKKYGTGSMYFDGSGDNVRSTADATLTTFGTADYTIEFWVYYISMPGYVVLFDARPSSVGMQLFSSSSGILYFDLKNGAFTQLFRINTTSGALTTGSWHHVAVSRNSGTTRLFVNGDLKASAADTFSYVGVAERPVIGSNYSGTENLNGYIDDLRITKGVARYTANFTPPTAALPDY